MLARWDQGEHSVQRKIKWCKGARKEKGGGGKRRRGIKACVQSYCGGAKGGQGKGRKNQGGLGGEIFLFEARGKKRVSQRRRGIRARGGGGSGKNQREGEPEKYPSNSKRLKGTLRQLKGKAIIEKRRLGRGQFKEANYVLFREWGEPQNSFGENGSSFFL